MIAYKFLSQGAVGPFTGFRWPVPAAGEPGAWVDAPRPGRDLGVHACRTADLPYWLDDELWLAELDGELAVGEHQVVGARGRLLARIEDWEREARGAFGIDCALRLRARAVEALRAAGDTRAAEALAAAGDVAAIPEAARAAEAAARGDAALVAAFAGDAAGLVLAGNAPSAAYVCARAAAAIEGGPHGFAGERARQAAWIAARLALDRGDATSA
ncbi:hypothetical protein [Anaeromyxobacter oryzae]|uniref:Uncharacterized protein n=1 Tax=Anaeromyxobacter oryzae TaxID=2918170 RepID=A0ABM7X2P9_9BACT|nr:hypothetical protein [Anaeromyxobacter oryzae]BDG06067.1 hypothetical protein AMOR_50630 [Anaeromyxobacter oryzae]